jgi:septum site-determining protein MinC
MATEALSLPAIHIRGRSFMALIVAPETPLAAWLAALDQQMRRAADFFADRPVVANLAAVFAAEGEQEAVLSALDALVARDLRVIGVEGIDPALLAHTRWARLPTTLQGRDVKREPKAERPAATSPAPSLLIDRPVRSGQSIVFEHGDVTVVGPIASGAEVIAGGSIHVYGALRGRAIAGLRTGASARIFCRRLEAELVAVDGLYRTAERWGEGLHGRPVQIQRDRGVLSLSALD